MNKKMSVLLIVFIIVLILVRYNVTKEQTYKVYGMNEDIELMGVEGIADETIFKSYVRPAIGNQELDSILEIIITSDNDRNPLTIDINPYGCEKISQNNPEIYKNTLDTLECFKVSKGNEFNYLVTNKFLNTLYKQNGIKNIVEPSNKLVEGKDGEESVEIIYTASDTYTVYLGFEFELIEQSKGILRMK